MLFFLAKRKICSAILPIFAANHGPNLCRYASKPNPKPINPIIVDYLVASFGFSPDKAARASKPAEHHLKSTDKPEAVRRFLSKHGFSDANIKTIFTLRPSLLVASPEGTLDPNLRALRDVGLSTSTLTQLILSAPTVLNTSSAAPRIIFWRDFLGGDQLALLKVFKQNLGLANLDISRTISPKISLLRSHGLSTHHIQRILFKARRIVLAKVSVLEEALKRAKEFGFQPESKMFAVGLHVMMVASREVLQKKMELLKSFGWSEKEFFSALHKTPNMMALSEVNLRAKMDFLIREARCEPSYIASHPLILTVSLEKRLRPRLHVLDLLESKGLSNKSRSLSSAIAITSEVFVDRFINPHKDQISGLHEAYLAACT